MMSPKTCLLAAAAMTGLSGAAQAQDFYGTFMLGYSQQATDAEAYGNNVAVDPDFPALFDSGDGAVGAIGIGYAFNDSFRIEGRLGFHESDFNSRRVGTGARAGEEYILNGDLKSTTLTIEGFYDIQNSTAITPYLKAGVGVSRNHYSARLGGAGVSAFDAFDGVADGYYDAYADQSSTEFTWNVGIGASVQLSEKVVGFAEYQYISLGDASTGQDSFTDGFNVDADAHEILFGIRATF